MIFEAQCEDKKYKIKLEKQKKMYSIVINDTKYEVPSNWQNILVLENKVFHATSYKQEKNQYHTFVNGRTVRLKLQTEQEKLHDSLAQEDEANHLTTSMPGKIVKVMVQVGDVVHKGQSLVIMEAMKMENVLKSPCEGTIQEIKVQEGSSVDAGATLIRIKIQ
ncbi:MAG: acetyl-CoA carboxylase biotin carboxyl carrier protein subunit [Deltaproteobacteria bacterium]|nr:acetyl-CoA carboxylase biotin carboxyl carrier protein subunit [Deltaproteobacteria bacterium]